MLGGSIGPFVAGTTGIFQDSAATIRIVVPKWQVGGGVHGLENVGYGALSTKIYVMIPW